MSEMREPLVRAEKALTEGRLDDSDREALDKLVIALWLNRRMEHDGLRDQLTQLQAELSRAEMKVAELTALVEKLRKEKVDLEFERDQYLRSLYALLPKPEFTFTEEELDDLRNNGGSLENLIRELEGARGE